MLRSLWRVLRLTVKTLLIVLISGVLLPLATGATALGIVLFTPVPVNIPEPKKLPVIVPSRVYDVYGDEIHIFRQFDSNIPLRKEDVPTVLKQAIISAEDRNFYAHNGIDLRGSIRAMVRDIQAKDAKQGGSTITQQYVKNVYANNDAIEVAADRAATETAPAPAPARIEPVTRIGGRRNLSQKLREAIIANRLDRVTDKEEILFGYMTNIFLGNGAYGVAAASQTYFRKPVSALTLSESATLAGIIPAPSEYEPRHNTKRAEFKRTTVLKAMRDEGYISETEYVTALSQHLWVESQGAPPSGQPVTLVYEQQQNAAKHPYFVDYVRRHLLATYGEAALYGSGLQIHTTIDPKIQADADKAIETALKGTKAPLEMALVSVEPLTGFVRAMVGGRDFTVDNVNLALGKCPEPADFEKLIRKPTPKVVPSCQKHNDIDGGGTGRSPGSSLKPIVLAAAFAQGIPPTTVLDGSPYQPKCAGNKPIQNYEGASYGPVNLREATIRSVNTAYARLGYEYVGIENVAKMAQNLGITSAWYDPRRHCASYSLGGIDVSPLEMAAAYSVFAARGLRADTTPILRVLDARGNVLEDNEINRTRRVISQAVADNVTSTLEAVVVSGTGRRAQLADRPAAGKTGTSQGYGNAWFVGYTPTLSTAVWMGYKDKPRPLSGIKGIARVAGGTIPAQTWQQFMSQAMDGVPPTGFTQPAPIKRIQRVDPKILKQRQERAGFDPGARRSVATAEAQTFAETLDGPTVEVPPQTIPPGALAIGPDGIPLGPFEGIQPTSENAGTAGFGAPNVPPAPPRTPVGLTGPVITAR